MAEKFRVAWDKGMAIARKARLADSESDTSGTSLNQSRKGKLI